MVWHSNELLALALLSPLTMNHCIQSIVKIVPLFNITHYATLLENPAVPSDMSMELQEPCQMGVMSRPCNFRRP